MVIGNYEQIAASHPTDYEYQWEIIRTHLYMR